MSARTILFFLFINSFTAHADLNAIQACLKSGFQASTQRNGIVAAAVSADDARVMTFGAARADQIFEIGSITKVFTSNLLAQRVADRRLKLSDPIPAAYQKPGTITYQHLTTHTSGIIGGNFNGFHGPNALSPYEGLTIPLFKSLYAQTDLAAPPGTAWIYSNLGESLLGLIMAERDSTRYEDLVKKEIFSELNMNDSYFAVPATQVARFADGHIVELGQPLQPYPHWDLSQTAIDPAGGIRSSIGDMIIFARANLVPDSTKLSSAIQISHQPLYDLGGGKSWIAMNWIVEPALQLVWHNGSTIGFQSILAISRKWNVAVVALSDTGVFVTGANGKPALSTDLEEAVFNCLK
jgi:CubicO group peptidase (beta-lactamase class C family)